MLKLKLAVLAVVVAIVALAVSSAGASGAHKTQTLRFFDKPTSIIVTTSDGKVIDKPPYPDAKPGDVLDVYSLDFYGNHKKHSKRFAGSEHLRCVFGTGEPDCTSTVALGRSLLVFRGNKLVDGAGRFFGATGRVLSTKEVPGGTDAVAKIKLAKH
jgi:hypothetical protein